MMAEFLKPIEVNDDTLGLDAIREVGPGGHFFGAAHTLERFETALYAPILSDWRNFQAWQEVGAPDTFQRANRLYQQILNDYQPPPLDAGIRDELDAFVAKRKAEGGVASS
jgi:trimethylamine--corrinoid protein Co-methyltransferase